MYDFHTFSPHFVCCFSQFWWLPLRHNIFKLWCIHFIFFSFVACSFDVIHEKALCCTRTQRLTPEFSSKSFHSLALHIGLLSFELFFVYDVKKGSNFLFLCMYISSCFRTICWKDCSFHNELSWWPCRKLICHNVWDYYFQFCFVDL